MGMMDVQGRRPVPVAEAMINALPLSLSSKQDPGHAGSPAALAALMAAVADEQPSPDTAQALAEQRAREQRMREALAAARAEAAQAQQELAAVKEAAVKAAELEHKAREEASG